MTTVDAVEELLPDVHRLTALGAGTPSCGTRGHPAGRVCLVPSAEIGLAELREAISPRFGGAGRRDAGVGVRGPVDRLRYDTDRGR